MSARVICQVRNLSLRAWCAQGSLGTRSLGALVCFGVKCSVNLKIEVVCPYKCRDRCLAINFALPENPQNLHVAGFNQIGHFVCNRYLM